MQHFINKFFDKGGKNCFVLVEIATNFPFHTIIRSSTINTEKYARTVQRKENALYQLKSLWNIGRKWKYLWEITLKQKETIRKDKYIKQLNTTRNEILT